MESAVGLRQLVLVDVEALAFQAARILVAPGVRYVRHDLLVAASDHGTAVEVEAFAPVSARREIAHLGIEDCHGHGRILEEELQLTGCDGETVLRLNPGLHFFQDIAGRVAHVDMIGDHRGEIR